MKLIIIGVGAAAAELTHFVNHSNKYFKTKIKISGYLDLKSGKKEFLKKYDFSKKFLGNLESHNFSKSIFYIVAINNIGIRKKIFYLLKLKKVKIANFIHPTAVIADSARIGKGNIIYPYCLIGPNVKIADFNFFNCNVAIGHDSNIYNNNIFSPNCCIAGSVKINMNNFFGLKSAVIPDRKIGKDNIIQAGMIIDKDISNGNVIFHRFKEKIILK